MVLIPVLDLRHGLVVRGIAGRRDDYRPIQTHFAQDAEPLAIAAAIRAAFGTREFYVADLDGIVDGRPRTHLYRRLAAEGHSLNVDAGIRRPEDAEAVLAAGATRVVAGLETMAGPALLSALVRHLGADRIVFSLDLAAGAPMGELVAWETADPLTIACRALEVGVRRMIVLDLAAVGVGGGLSTLDLCRRLRARRPDACLITGGGVRDVRDVRAALDAGADQLLVASALHDGRITPGEVAALQDERRRQSAAARVVPPRTDSNTSG